MLETLLGTLLGGVFRVVPEIMSLSDKKNERKHELDMFDKQISADQIRAQMAIEAEKVKGDIALGASELQAIIEATKAQGTVTGVKWVDALSSLMRPLITFWWVIVLYTGALWAQFYQMWIHNVSTVDAILKLWGPDERAIVASIISFWFVDRSIRKSR
jgi:hypothetical protein